MRRFVIFCCHSKKFPAGAKRCFNVHLMLFGRWVWNEKLMASLEHITFYNSETLQIKLEYPPLRYFRMHFLSSFSFVVANKKLCNNDTILELERNLFYKSAIGLGWCETNFKFSKLDLYSNVRESENVIFTLTSLHPTLFRRSSNVIWML